MNETEEQAYKETAPCKCGELIFEKEARAIQRSKAFQQMVLEKLNIHEPKKKKKKRKKEKRKKKKKK